MLHHLYSFRRLLATSFLLVFANVLVGQCWCATINAPKRPAAAASHACCQPNAPAKAAHHKAGHSRHQSKRSHDCCRDKSASLLSSLTVPAEKHLLDLAPALLPPVPQLRFAVRSASHWDRTAAVRLVTSRHLPPKIPDIRIFIQSLTV